MYKIESGLNIFRIFEDININLMHFKNIFSTFFLKKYYSFKILIFKYIFLDSFFQYYFRIRNFNSNNQMMFMKIKYGNYFDFLKLYSLFRFKKSVSYNIYHFLNNINAKQILYQIEKRGLNSDNEKK